MITEKYRPRSLDKFVGQMHLRATMDTYMTMDVMDIPNLYMIGPNGVGKSTFASIIAKRASGDVVENILKLNAAEERGIDTIRKRVLPVARTATMFGGRRVIWFEESYMLTTEAQEALKDTMDDHPDVLWVYTTNRQMDIGVAQRCSPLQFVAVEPQHIEKLLREVAQLENIELSDEAVRNVLSVSEGSVRRALAELESPPSVNYSRVLFMKACQSFDDSASVYLKSLVDPLTFLKEVPVMVATSTAPVKFKKVICVLAAEHAHKLASGVPPTVVMLSFLASISNEWGLRYG